MPSYSLKCRKNTRKVKTRELQKQKGKNQKFYQNAV